MIKPICEYVFRNVNGVWRDVAGNGDILADVLRRHNMLVDDKAVFIRFKDYERGVCIWYRAYNEAKITVTIWRLG